MIEILTSLLVGFLFLAALGRQLALIKVLGLGVVGLSLVMIKLVNGRIKLPRFFKGYLLILVIFGLSLLWSKDRVSSLVDVLMFVVGGGFWLLSFNLKDEWQRYWDKLVVGLGLVLAGLWWWRVGYIKDLTVRSFSLFEHYSGFKNHLILGDYWAVAIVLLLARLIKKPKKWLDWIWLLVGSLIVYASQSRAALVSMVVGILYLTKVKGGGQVNKWSKWLIGMVVVMFLAFGLNKSTFLVRDYYFQSLVGLVRHPLGVGLRNFGIISRDPSNHVWGRGDFSFNAHSLVFEMISSIGVFSLVFIYWFYQVVRSIWYKKSERGLVYRVAFIALTTNFLLFASYLSPTMLWLWFVFLGMIG